jgi:rhodanese-related sulfurtransferase
MEEVISGVLDVRNREEFLKLHVKDSANIPDVAVADRLFELPPPRGGDDEPPVKLVVVHDLEAAAVDELVGFLSGKGYIVDVTVRGSELVAGGPFVLASGKSFGCLWKPNPALAKCWDQIKNVANNSGKTHARLTCIDLAAGNGRDCLFVAREGWHALGIDYLERQWSKIDAITARAMEELPDDELRVFGSVQSNNMDLEKESPGFFEKNKFFCFSKTVFFTRIGY